MRNLLRELLKSTALVIAVPVFVAGYLLVWKLGEPPAPKEIVTQPAIEEKPTIENTSLIVESETAPIEKMPPKTPMRDEHKALEFGEKAGLQGGNETLARPN
jgi:hypothetical protein